MEINHALVGHWVCGLTQRGSDVTCRSFDPTLGGWRIGKLAGRMAGRMTWRETYDPARK